jgi:hypothetical protein
MISNMKTISNIDNGAPGQGNAGRKTGDSGGHKQKNMSLGSRVQDSGFTVQGVMLRKNVGWHIFLDERWVGGCQPKVMNL